MLSAFEKLYLYVVGHYVIDIRNSFILSRDIRTLDYVIWYRRSIFPLRYVVSGIKSDIKFRWEILMKD